MYAVIPLCGDCEETKELCCIPLTSSVRFGNWDNTLCLTLCRCVSVYPHQTCVSGGGSTCPYISVDLLICSIWPWMIRQVEAPQWNETHPFPLSAIRRCNDLREDGKEKEPTEMDPWTSQLCSSLMLWPASPPGAVCSGYRRRSGLVCLWCERWDVSWVILYIESHI